MMVQVGRGLSLAVFTVLVAGAGCGSDPVSEPAIPTTPMPEEVATTSMPEEVATTSMPDDSDQAASYPAPEWAGREMELQFASPQGWTYRDSVSLEVPQIHFEKDISTSPPGTARLIATASSIPRTPGGGSTWHSFATTNPDRNGPDAEIVRPPQLLFEIPGGAYGENEGYIGSNICSAELFDSMFECLRSHNNNYSDGESDASDSVTEADIDAFLSQVSNTPPKLSLLVFIPQGGGYDVNEFRLVFDATGTLIDDDDSGVTAQLQ